MSTTLHDVSYDCAKCGAHVEGQTSDPTPRTLCFDCERTEENKAAGFAAKPCADCGKEIAPRNPEATLCFGCGYSAHQRSYEEEYADPISFLQEHMPDAKVGMWNTGGGCMAIGVQGDGFHMLVTDDEGPLCGKWEEATGWLIGLYDDEGERFDGTDDSAMLWADGRASLQTLGQAMQALIAKIKAEQGVDAFSWKEALPELGDAEVEFSIHATIFVTVGSDGLRKMTIVAGDCLHFHEASNIDPGDGNVEDSPMVAAAKEYADSHEWPMLRDLPESIVWEA